MSVYSLTMNIISLFMLIALFSPLKKYYCLKMLKAIPGIPTIGYYDTNYVKDVIFNTRRYNRKSDYVVNLEFTTLVPLGKNVSLSIILYEYLHNEYRRSFIELHYNACTLINKDKLIGAVVRRAGVTACPLSAGRYQLLNMTFDQEFPNVFPFEKGKGELVAKLSPSGKLLARGDIVLTFKQREV